MPNKKPNILLITLDQQRADWLGYAGADWVRTPNLDRLAKQGTVFTHCLSNSPICVPARVALATGHRPHLLGCLDNHYFLPRHVPTCYQQFRDHGYRVGLVGKLDLAKPNHYNGRHGDRPCAYSFGFTHPCECEGKMHAGSSYEPLGPYNYWLQERGLLKSFVDDYKAREAVGWIRANHDSVLPIDAHEEHFIADRSCRWLETIADDFPWFLHVSFVGPHDPFDPPTEYADRYRDAEMPAPIPADEGNDNPWRVKRDCQLSADETLSCRRQYSAAVEFIDAQIGRIITALEKRGESDNTYIVFTSDHGEILGDHGAYTKGDPCESAIRVPLFISGPGVPAGQRSDTLVELMDLSPTMLDLAEVPQIPELEACSLLPVINGEKSKHREEALITLRQFECIRSTGWKFIRYNDGFTALYNLREDPDERHNLAPGNPEKCHEMMSRMRALNVDRQNR